MQIKKSFLYTLSLILHINLILISVTNALNQDGLILQKAKLSFYDPAGSLANWSDRDATPCNWTGITCDNKESVVSVILYNSSLSGSFPISLCLLPSLSTIDLSENSINSSLPLSISTCRNLTFLDVSQNLFVGPVPSTLSDLIFLRYLSLEGNNFAGEIPTTFGNFRQLEVLELSNNVLTGTIPAALGNITSLKKLELAYNTFSQGDLPPEFGNLTNLEELWLTNCNLLGTIPQSLGRLSRLTNLDVGQNKLTGLIPSVIFHLKLIEQIELYDNGFTGKLPAGWLKLTKLRRFDASRNKLTGVISNELCELPLESLNLYNNRLEGSIPDSIAKSPNLQELHLYGNQLVGKLPSELGKYSYLRTFDVSNNSLSGEIPGFLCHNGALEELVLINNQFSGIIPLDIVKCRTLMRIRMRGNRLHGEVPPEFWGLPHVYLLDLHGNAFSENISSLIYGAQNLSNLDISDNKFSGSIPSEIGSLKKLGKFYANNNELRGEIPSTIVNLGQLGLLNLCNNKLSGEIPKGIKSLTMLNELNLANNDLSGKIPGEIGELPVLNYLDLSNNHFSGLIPISLQNLKLNKLNVSNNQLSGYIPDFLFLDIYRDSFLGNPDLCLNDSHSCNSRSGGNNGVLSWIYWLILVALGVVCLVGLVWLMRKYKKITKTKKGIATSTWTSFHNLDFSELEINDSLEEANVIGRGGSGNVYKVVLSNGEIMAVKKLLETPYENKNSEFEVEVETLGKIRHKNIVRLWCCCSKENYKLLVYEYMINGSLGDVLHGNNTRTFLDWPMRFRIALGAAEGLSYLHHDAVPSIVHRDVKSNNILLDENFEAKISDFGVAKVVKSVANGGGVETMSMIAGSCGYIAPEYAYTLRVSEKSDIYSFGIVIFELVTGKPPIDPEFGDKDLAAWVRTTLDKNGIDHVLDPRLESKFKEYIIKVLDIGLLCTSAIPINRPSMRRVVKMLREMRASMDSTIPI
ncbi:hypothetical protein ACJIZ3_010705 [Penstemon smallii]|uniref:non-specific serine/threonine protein kinase n=1 Tax=Penstemon smallii TaxID=265156 RepID=A0ABD3UL70_9LAMI